VVKATDDEWKSAIANIYENYRIYSQSGGVEQVVFDQTSGKCATRSHALIERLWPRLRVPCSGRMLDVGCGNGSFLAAFSRKASGWSLVGSEWGLQNKARVEAIPGVEGLVASEVGAIPGTFNIVSMIHVLEHIPEPRATLQCIWEKLVPDGQLIVQVPDLSSNPFDLFVADHCTHFVSEALRSLIEGIGFVIEFIAEGLIAKELTLVARKPRQVTPARPRSVDDAGALLSNHARWLESLTRRSRELHTGGQLGILGTAIAGTWLDICLSGRNSFFVDEDLSRVSGSHLDRPIYHPSQTPLDSDVVVSLPQPIAERARLRLAAFYPHVRWHSVSL
jgi:SAM-dependent methyltransferase